MPHLVWWFGCLESIPQAKEAELCLDSRAKISDAPTSFNPEQEQSVDCSHPHSPPQSPLPTSENPALASEPDCGRGGQISHHAKPCTCCNNRPRACSLETCPRCPGSATLAVGSGEPVHAKSSSCASSCHHPGLLASRKTGQLNKAQLPRAQEVLNFKASRPSPFWFQKQAGKGGLVVPGRFYLYQRRQIAQSLTPLVETSVRRSTRIRTGRDGFHSVRIEEVSSKKRKRPGVVLIDEATGKAGPVPIEILRGWIVKCGIAPDAGALYQSYSQ